jgi:hypothetical protein
MEENARRQREFVERIQNQGDLEAVDELIAEDLVDHIDVAGLMAQLDAAG